MVERVQRKPPIFFVNLFSLFFWKRCSKTFNYKPLVCFQAREAGWTKIKSNARKPYLNKKKTVIETIEYCVRYVYQKHKASGWIKSKKPILKHRYTYKLIVLLECFLFVVHECVFIRSDTFICKTFDLFFWKKAAAPMSFSVVFHHRVKKTN